MTTTNPSSEEKSGRSGDEAMRLLKEISRKVDYVITMLREEELRFPYHSTFMETEQYDRDRTR
jgi:hypothetical protein